MGRIECSLRLRCAAFCVILFAAPWCASAVTINWSQVGFPGNANDPATGNLYGSVGYTYNIGKYDVTNSQYVEFLNSNDATGANLRGLYSGDMSNPTYGGITHTPGAAPGSKYSVMGGNGQYPVTFVTFFSALRFANWLHNGQVAGMTESGAYTLTGGGPTPSNANSIARSVGATVFLPSENEWYKATYYNPNTSSYYLYGTSSNTAPNATGPTATPNSANFFPGGPNNRTAVGAYSGTMSPFGAYDMAGNVFQWNEALLSGSSRVVRGGSFAGVSDYLLSSGRYSFDPSDSIFYVGFRVAGVPEPGSVVLFAAGGIALLVFRRRRALQSQP